MNGEKGHRPAENGRKLFPSPDTAFAAVIFIVAAMLNLQFLDGSNINYILSGHDEYLTVREVYSILHPLSIKHFFMAVISGDVLYYGRVMFYTDALIAFLPYKFYGIQGMVYAIRMTHVLLVLAGLLIMARTFLKDWKYRVLFFAGTMILYYSAYFFMVPKPEPIQLLLLSLFFYYFKKNDLAFGKFFIFLGLAYGAKFNLITILPVLFILPLLKKNMELGLKIRKIAIAVLYFLLGLVTAIPCLLLSPVKPVFLKSYYNATFANTNQYDDDAALGVWEWISKGWFGAYNGGLAGGILLLVLVTVILLIGIKTFLKRKEVNDESILIIIGLGLILPVILLTGRLWPHYLWTGYVFLFLGLVVCLEGLLKEGIRKNYRIAFSAALSAVLILSLYCSFAQGYKLFSLEDRSGKVKEYGQQAYRYLKNKEREFIAVQELSVPYPFEDFLVANPYNPFTSSLDQKAEKKFIWTSFITPEIVEETKAGYIITNKLNFEETGRTLQTEKDSTIFKNNLSMRNELGKTVFPDTIFGNIRIYKVLRKTGDSE